MVTKKLDGLDERPEVAALLRNIKAELPPLKRLFDDCSSHSGYEDPIYRFYHQSFKGYGLASMTRGIVSALQALSPDRKLNPWFLQIVHDGIGARFEPEHNQRWLEVTRPIVEAFFHARYFLEMAVRYGDELDAPPRILSSGWASLLYLYQLR